MNDIALWLPALILPLFCLIYSAAARRETYFPLPKGISKKLRDPHTVFLAMLCVMVAAAALRIAESFGRSAFDGTGALNLIHTAGLVSLIVLFCLFALYICVLPIADRRGAAVLAAVAAAGVLVRSIWSAPVDLFYVSVSLFGCMAMTERETDASERGMSDRFRAFSIFVVALTFFLVIVINAALIMNLNRTQSDEIGRIQLDVIRSDLQDTLSSAEAKLLHTAIRAEKLLDEDVSRASLEQFILDQQGSFLADENFMSIYIAGKDWHFVPDFDAPPDFHASERVWYIGAEERPGEVYITEPYKDVNTGGMCFTISTLLSDGETVVGMDLNFSKVQESIREMTTGKDEAAVIVTDSGLIVGYTDMSLVGESAAEKLPEYETVLSRVMASQAHDSFQVKLDGRSCVIFSSETSNHWYLILSVSTETLYSESHRQIAALASVNLLMLLVLAVFYALSTQDRAQARLVLDKNRNYISVFSNKLHILTGRVLRLGDARLLRDDEYPEALAGHIRETGEDLSILADDMESYVETLRLRHEKERGKKKQEKSASVPSRRIRIGITPDVRSPASAERRIPASP